MTKQEIATLVEQLTVVDNKLSKKVVSEFKVVELKKMASYLQIKGYSKLLKKDLVIAVLKMLLCLQEDNAHRQTEKQSEAVLKEEVQTSSNKMTKEAFTVAFIKPLEKRFGFKTYWSGKDSERAGLGKITGNYYGWSFTGRTDAPIVMRFRANQQATFKTLIHEYAHSVLHRKGSDGEKMHKYEKEIEAETVAKGVCEQLNIPYHSTSYIERYQLKYRNKFGRSHHFYDYRLEVLEELIEEIAELLQSKANIVRKIAGEEVDIQRKLKQSQGYKYEVCCPTCSNSWKYKSKGKTVKNAHKYYCTSCGKQTLGKFIVKEL